MFTGIVEQLGQVYRVIESGANRDLIIRADMSESLAVDQSVSHNGVCLTVVAAGEGMHTVTVVKESLNRSNIGSLEEGAWVNLERCLRLGDRLDGHMVQGHVDEVIICTAVQEEQGSWRFTFALPNDPSLLVSKGSVCLNGVSLTIASLTEKDFSIAIIPYTYMHTSFKALSPGGLVNLEYDVLGKYVQRQLRKAQNT